MGNRLKRRTVLRGAGVALGLPLLDAMAVSAGASGPGADSQAGPVRFAALYFPNGVNPHQWTPKGRGRQFELSETLKPLAALKDDILVFTDLWNAATNTGDGHYVKSAAWLCGTTITKTTGSDVRSNGVSLDQAAAQRIGHLTRLPSLELGTEPTSTGVDQAVGYTRLYGAHISWSSPHSPIAKEINPRLAFDRLFRTEKRPVRPAGSSEAEDLSSILDLVKTDADRLRKTVGRDDRVKLDEYFESVRAVEKRIAFESKKQADEYLSDAKVRAELSRLDGRIKDFYADPGKLRERGKDHSEHVRLMLDLIALAFWTDSTRLATFMFGNDVSNKSFAFCPGVNGLHHELSHHENDADKLKRFQLINRWHVEQYGYLLNKLKSIREGQGTLLDRSMILFGAAIRDSNAHDPHNLPLVLGGKGGGGLATGRHLVFKKDTPLCNLYVGLLRRLGVPIERFADSTGELPGLSDPNYNGSA